MAELTNVALVGTEAELVDVVTATSVNLKEFIISSYLENLTVDLAKQCSEWLEFSDVMALDFFIFAIQITELHSHDVILVPLDLDLADAVWGRMLFEGL